VENYGASQNMTIIQYQINKSNKFTNLNESEKAKVPS